MLAVRPPSAARPDRRPASPAQWLNWAAALALGASLLLHPASAQAAQYDWLQFDFDAQHSGNNTLETTITPGNVSGLHQVFQATLPDIADGAPAYLSAVATPSGTRNLLFVTTKDGHIIALDAQSGAQVWVRQNPPGTCRINGGSEPCYTTSSPAIDPNRHYVYSYGLDGYAHKYRVGDGAEITGGGWPELATLKGFDEKGSSDLSVAVSGGVSYLYVANGGYPGDAGDYQGHVTTINLATGAQHVFNALCSNQVDVHFVEKPGQPDCPQVRSAIWARAGVVYAPATGKIYMATGNGPFDPATFDWGDTVFALRPDGSGANGLPLDSYTPPDFQHLQQTDEDLGSTAPAILPVPATSAIKHLALQSGKDQKIRLLNLDNLSGQGGPGHVGGAVGPVIGVPQGGVVLTAPAVWVNPLTGQTWVFIANGNGISALALAVGQGGTPGLRLAWQKAAGGTSPIIADNVLYYVGPGGLQALNPLNGTVLWQDASINNIHWESPIVANGMLYVTDENSKLFAYGL